MTTRISRLLQKYQQINLTLLDQALVSGINFLTGILFARFLGVEEFGRFTLAWMVVLFANSIQMAMISSPMMSMGPKQSQEQAPSYYGAVFAQQICFSTLSFITIYCGVKFSKTLFPEWDIDHLAMPLAMVGFFFQNQDFLRRFFFATSQHKTALINDMISYLGQFILLTFLFMTMDMNTSLVLIIIAGTSAVAVVFGSFFLTRNTWSKITFFKVFKKNWQFSKWLIASAVLQWTSGNLFIIAAGGILGPAVVGAIKAAQNIMGISHILFHGLENIIPVKASIHYIQNGIPGLLSYLKKVTLLGGSPIVLLALTAILFPEKWLIVFYGIDYGGYGFILQWYAIIYLFIFIGLPLRTLLRTLEKTKSIFIANFIMAFSSILSVKFIVTSFGVQGVLFGVLGTQIILQASLLSSILIYLFKVNNFK